jgi:hypothetical protein
VGFEVFVANPKEKDDGFDASALAALVTPSQAPPSEPESDEEGDDAVLDLKALAASMAPPSTTADDEHEEEEDDEPQPIATAARASTPIAAESPKASAAAPSHGRTAEPARTTPKAAGGAKGGGAKSDVANKNVARSESKPAKKSPAKAPTGRAEVAPQREAPRAARAQEVVAEPKKSGTGLWIGIGLAVAAAIGIVWYVSQSDQPSEDVARADGPSPTQQQGASASEREEPREALPEEPAEVAPVGAETAEPPTEAAIEEPSEPTEVEPAEIEPAEREEPAATAMAQPTAMVQPTAMTVETAMAVETAMTAEPAMTETPVETAMTAEPAMTEPTMAETSMTSMTADNTLDTIFGNQTQMQEPAETAPAEMPDTPTRANVAQTLGRMMAQIRQCAGDQVGLANAAIIVNNDGSVASVQISGNPFGGTPQGACMEGVIRRARFQPFRQRTFQVRYPFALRAQQ